MNKPKAHRAHYIPNSHLDREWTLDFQHTRELTVQFIDSLLDILEKVPDYQFLMDSQTVPLEDYLQIRPEKEAVIRQYVQAKRLHIGPWYSAPDMNTISGESITRNLLVGHRMAADFGQVMKVGYTPFGFVHISQLPQIYEQFGIDTCFFYRGIPQLDGSEFIWEGPDGTRILSSRLSKQSRYNYFWNVWRQGLYHDQEARLDRCYDWRTGQLPFKMCDEEMRFDHGTILKARRQLDPAIVKEELRALFAREKEMFRTHEISFMHGFDTSAPELLEDEVLRLCQNLTEKDEELFYSSMPQYADALKEALVGVDLPVYRGEMKYPEIKPNGFHQTFVNIISTRSRQKIFTTKVENLLLRNTEPFAALATTLGAEWPKPYLDFAWREFLKCHPHDTIGGCCIDAIEEDTMHRLRQTQSISRCLLKSSLGRIQSVIDTSSLQSEDILITLFNPSPFSRSEVVTCYVDIPRELNLDSFVIVDATGHEVSFTATRTGNHGKIYRDVQDLAFFSNSDEYELALDGKDIPALGYATFALRQGVSTPAQGSMISSNNEMENDYLKVAIQPNGSLTITNKETGKSYTDFHVFEDVGEAGHPWMHMHVKQDMRVTSEDCNAIIRVVADTPLKASYEVKLTMMVPATSLYDLDKRYCALSEEDSWRSDERVALEICSTFTLTRDARSLDVATTVNNQAKNHRLRVTFPTGLNATSSFADNPYEVIERQIKRDATHPLYGMTDLDYPFLKFVDLHDADNGFAFIGMGLKEYEVLDDAKRTLGITLIRAVENWLCTTNVWDRVPGDMMQCLGENHYQYRLYFHAGDWKQSDLQCQAEALNYPLISCLAGVEKGGSLPLRQSFIEIDNLLITLSAMKQAEDGNGIIVRLYNPTDDEQSGTLTTLPAVKSAVYTNMNEEKQADARFGANHIELSLPPKKVQTLLLDMALEL